MKRIAIIAGTALALFASSAIAKDVEFDKEDIATRLIAMSAFVKTDCAGMNPDAQVIRTILDKLGVDPEQLVKIPRREMQGNLLILTYRNSRKEACNDLWKQFGPSGETLPGLLVRP